MCASEAAARTGRPARARDRDAWGHALRLSEEERHWLELLDHLPENARQLWEALKSVPELRRVLHCYGGCNLRVPRTIPGDRNHPLRRRLCLRCLRKLMAAFGGTLHSMCRAATRCWVGCASAKSLKPSAGTRRTASKQHSSRGLTGPTPTACLTAASGRFSKRKLRRRPQRACCIVWAIPQPRPGRAIPTTRCNLCRSQEKPSPGIF